MNRFLLTLLALLTGLVAQVSPAQAALRGGGEAEVGSVQAAGIVVRLAQVDLPTGHASVTYSVVLSDVPPLRIFAVVARSVRIGIDRARE